MKEILSLINNKYFLWLVIFLGAAGVFALRQWQDNNYQDAIETYRRQLDGKLSEKERELQALHAELGVAKSELMTQKELTAAAKKESLEIDRNFKKFIDKHKLELASRDLVIAQLKQQLEGGVTDVVVSEGCQDIEKRCVISYSWHDHRSRFKLLDPNIFKKDDELFESNQLFRIYGEVYQQKDGSLQTRRVILREITKNSNGLYEEIPDGKAEVLDATFQYVNPPSLEDVGNKKLFKLRFIAVGGVNVIGSPGATRIGTGLEFFNYKGIGVNSHSALDFKNVMGSELRLGVSYSPRILGNELNLAIGAALGTPVNGLFKDYTGSLNILFYINN